VDDKIYMVEVELGLEGFALFIKLLMKIYSESYYIEWTERKAKIFARQNNSNIDVINKLINVCINENIFNKKIYKKYHILTSNGIQKRYFEAIKRRKEIYVIKEYLINGIEKYINSNKYPINVYINSLNDDNNPQSKVKESIVEENKVKKKYMDTVFLTDDEYKKLIEELGEPLTKEYIKDLSLYIQSKGKKYKSHYATILTWNRNDIKKGVNRNGRNISNNKRTETDKDKEQRYEQYRKLEEIH